MLQLALLSDRHASAAVIPLYNLTPQHPDWRKWQTYYLDRPEDYPLDGNCPVETIDRYPAITNNIYRGSFQRCGFQEYTITLNDQTWQLITIDPQIDQQLLDYRSIDITVAGRLNKSGNWLIVEQIIQ
jgi:hypothetical protein